MPIATAQTSLVRGLASWILPSLGVMLLSLLWLMAATLLLRRLAGAFSVPLSAPSLFTVSAVTAALAAGARLFYTPFQASSRTKNQREWRQNVLPILPTAALFLLGISLSIPETSVAGSVALWTFLVVEELWAWIPPDTYLPRFSRRFLSKPLSKLRRVTHPLAVSRNTLGPWSKSIRTPSLLKPRSGLAPSVTQQIVRTTLAADEELIQGQIRVAFIAGQRSANAHLAFCPPFDQTPRIKFRQTSGPLARVKLAQVYPYGARFELKLPAAADSTSIVLAFSVTGKSLAIL